jgi:lipopolysaccharide/colanic/teichoic acid biosynthesis glycosyltransferase
MLSKSRPRRWTLKIEQLIKLLLDKSIAAIVLLLLFPIILITGIAVYFKLGNPVIFAQPRPGKDSRIFTFYKFRTMTDARDSAGNFLPDNERITPFGEWLRQTSLDELPQLWNVFIGEMSFIGPRPLIVAYLDRYTPEQARRHEVLPGITGLAQINGRNAISWEEKFNLDVWYIDNWTLWLDLKILFLTVGKVLKRDGINQEGYATSEEFKGTMNS